MADILLMEDDPDQAYMLDALLSAAGHKVVVAYSGSEAWAMLNAQRFDVLLTDMRVYSAPYMNKSDGGLALIIRIRGAKGPNVPEWLQTLRIIAISGANFSDHGPLERAGIFGADLCLRKPVAKYDLLNGIYTVLLKKDKPPE